MMEVVILVLVVIAAILAIISGVWVALALITAISARRTIPETQSPQMNKAVIHKKIVS